MSTSNIFVLITAIATALDGALAQIFPAEATLIHAAGALVMTVLAQLSHQSGHAAALKSAAK